MISDNPPLYKKASFQHLRNIGNLGYDLHRTVKLIHGRVDEFDPAAEGPSGSGVGGKDQGLPHPQCPCLI
jgi:hypothetical protein